MPLTHRIERIAEQVREEISQMLATEVSDPGIGLVTVTRVRVTPDLSLARVYWTILGTPAERKDTTRALRRVAGYVRHLLAERLSLRRVPEVQFLFDEGAAAQDRVEQIIQELHAEEAARAAAAGETAPEREDVAPAPDAGTSTIPTSEPPKDTDAR